MSDNRTALCLRLSSEDWELWKHTPKSFPERVRSGPLPLGGDPPSLVALPATSARCHPLWLQTDDPSLVDEMARLQLTALGLVREGDDVPIETIPIHVADGRSLILGIVPGNIPPPALNEFQKARFVPSPLLERLPADALTFWHESGHWVFVFSRGEQPAYWFTRAPGPVDLPMIADLRATTLRLLVDGVIAPLKEIHSWHPLSPEESALFLHGLNATVICGERPPPRNDSDKTLDLPPPEIIRRRRSAALRAKIGSWTAALAGILLVAVGVLGYQIAARQIKVGELRAKIAERQDRVEQISTEQLRWARLRPAVDPDLAPLERLHQLASLMPASGLRLTLFTQSIVEGELKVVIAGEASNTPTAFSFTEAVKNHPAWAGYTWNIPQPTILPNSTARFRMEGALAYATAIPVE